jgi:rRNA maturation endonuclease Nob1
MFSLALWSLLRDHSGLMESDIKKYLEKIDLLDGKLDGKVDLKTEVVECVACSRKLIDTAKVCPYCGQKNAKYRVYKSL